MLKQISPRLLHIQPQLRRKMASCCNVTEATTTRPSTLSSPPVQALAPVGQCQFNDSFTPVTLLAKYEVSPTSYVLRFGLPDDKKSLGLSTCACLLAGAPIGEEKDGEKQLVIRPYTPISTNALDGAFDLLIKKYESGTMSKYLTELTPSTTEQPVSFKHIPFNVKIQYPFNNTKFIGMIAGGTGITPMIQALHAILGETSANKSDVSLLYGSQNSKDILGEEMLTNWSKSHSDKFNVTHVLSNEEEGSTFKGERGFITEDLIKKSFPAPSDGNGVMIFVCGPPAMYNALCGPREEKEITGILGSMGYSAEQVYKF